MNFIINNERWRIEEKSQKEIKEKHNNRRGQGEKEDIESTDMRYYGSTFCDENLILIDKDLHADRKVKTLLHELMHCYINSYMTHCDKEYNEEDVADIFANAYIIIGDIFNKYFE